MAAKKRTKTKHAKTGPPAAEQPGTERSPPLDEGAVGPQGVGPVELERASPDPPVAGICASAGGLDAFKRFFSAMPGDSGIAFVMIPHLDPRHESLMVELISRHTSMPVVEATDGTIVKANNVYIIPPNKYMTISDGILRLRGPVERGGPQTSMDVFLRSLGDDKLDKGICIIMSGTGGHGTVGLKAVKAAGGVTIVQDPSTAEYPGMPQSALATGLADYVLPVEEMPQALIKYLQHYYVNGDRVQEAGAADYLNPILALLRVRTKLDFRYYRKKMLTRRIDRRMSLSHHSQLSEYLAFLRQHPDELQQLARDLLISVTSFFRDPEAWQTIQTEIVAPLVRSKEHDASIRVWSAGCATGEEAYSIGLLLLEQVAAAQKSCQVQVFATDVDDTALEVARQAVYSESISADVPPERLARFFTRVNESNYQVSKQLRECVIFARQNLITDAPFSKLDLIVCRNLLIYLEPEVQRKVISLLHFALLDGGFLFLGPSETIGRQTDLFEPISKKWRIYRRIGPARADRIEFPIASARDPLAPPQRAVRTGQPRPISFADLTHRVLLSKYAPAAVLINRKYEVLYIFGEADRYLAVTPGMPTVDLLSMAREGLRAKLRSAVHRAIRDNAPVTLGDVQIKRNGHYYPVMVVLTPVQDVQIADGLLLVTFHDLDQETPTLPQPPQSDREESVVHQLESELKATKEDLQTTIEELESSNEELKASNEEVMSMNEELQSANEELETSKEELQSLNEELTTVNNQLQDKVEDLESTNNDITNLFNCTDIATVFLDSGLHIRRFTPATARYFKVIPTDVGRSLGDIAMKFADDRLLADAQRILRDLTPREREVPTEDGGYSVRRILPYRTQDDRIAGVVVTFMDVTERRRYEQELQAHQLRLAGNLEAMTRLHELVMRLSYRRDLSSAMEELLDSIVAVLGSPMGTLHLLDSADGEIKLDCHLGVTGEVLGSYVKACTEISTPCKTALASRKLVIIEDVQAASEYGNYEKVAANAGFRSELAAPLISSGGTAVGVVSTFFREPRRFSEEELRLVELYGRLAADLTERLRAQEELQRLNDRLEHIVFERTSALAMVCDVASMANSTSDVDAAILYALKRVSEHNGWSCGHAWIQAEHDPDELYATDVWYEEAPERFAKLKELIPSVRLRRGEGMIGRVFATGKPEFTTNIKEHLSELKAPLAESLGVQSACAFPIRLGAGVAGVLEFFSDKLTEPKDQQPEAMGSVGTLLGRVIERRRAEQDLRHLATIVQTAQDAIHTRKLDGTITSWNQGAERLYGCSASEVIGQSFRSFVPSDLVGELDEVEARIEAGREVPPFETRRLCKSGKTIHISLSLSGIKDATGRVIGFTSIARDITERKRAEEALAASEERHRHLSEELRLVTDAMSAPVARCGRDLRYVWVSKPYADWLGRRLEEFRGRPLVEMIGQEALDRIRPYVDRVLAGEEVDYELEANLPGLGNRWVSVSSRPTFGPDRVPDGWVAVIIDIDQRKRAEQSLAESEERMSLAVQATRDGIWDCDLVRGTVWWNARYDELFGPRPPETAGSWEWWFERIHPEDRDRVRESFHAALASHETYWTSEYRMMFADGSYGHVSDRSCFARNEDGKATRILGVMSDITERIKNAALLRASEVRLGAILKTAADAVITIDHSGIIDSVNAAAERMFGYTKEELVGQNVKMLMTPPDREAHDGYLARYLATGEKHIIDTGREVRARRKDGSVFPADLAVSDVSHLSLFTGIIRDVTRRKQLEADVLEVASMEQKRIGQDLHDYLGQGLTALSLLSRELQATLESNSGNAMALGERIAENLERCQKDLRTVMLGLIPTEMDCRDLRAALDELVLRAQREWNVVCQYEAPDLVMIEDGQVAYHLYQIAVEAVHNAVKHARAEIIRISLLPAGKGAIVSVRDDGIGLPESTEKGRGSGLRIMHSRAGIIGAKLTIERVEPHGTEVKCVFSR